MLMEKIAFFIWTAGFAGLVPVAPGTAGSVVGVVLLILVRAAARNDWIELLVLVMVMACLLYTSPSPRDGLLSRMPSSA